MDPGLVSIVGFGAVAIFGGLVMAAVSFFSMKETTYEAVIEKKRHELEISDQEKVKVSKQKRENQKKKLGSKKKKSASTADTNDDATVKKARAAHGEDAKTESALKNRNQKKEDNEAAELKAQMKNDQKQIIADAQRKDLPSKSEDTTEKKKKVFTVVANKKSTKAEEKKQDKNEDKKDKGINKKATKVEDKTLAKTDNKKATKIDTGTKKDAKIEGKKVTKSDEKKATIVEDKKPKGNDKKETKSDKKTAGKATQNVDVEKSNKSKKTTLQSDESLVEMIRSANLADDTVFMLVELLNEKSKQGKWMKTDAASRKAAELQRQLEQKTVENARQSDEFCQNQSKLKNVTQELEAMKAKYSKNLATLDEMKHRDNSLKQEMRMKLEEKQQQINVLQTQVQSPSEVSSLKSLRDQNDILIQTIQGNAKTLSEKQAELQSFQNQLEEWKKRCSEVEMKMADYQIQTQRQIDTDAAYAKHLDELKMKIMTADARYNQLETEYQKVQGDLQIKQSESAKLLEQVVLLNSSSEQHSAMERQIADTKQALEQRLIDLERNEVQQADERAKLHTCNKDLTKRLEETEKRNQILEEEILQQRNSANKVSENLQKSSDILSGKDLEISSLQASVEARKEEVTKLQIEVNKLKKRNDDLREKNWKAMEAVSVTEKCAKEKIADYQNEAERAMKSMHLSIRGQLQDAFPSITSTNQDFNSWLKEFSESAAKLGGSDESTLQEKEKQLEQLKEQNVLLNTKLTKKESSTAALQKSLDSSLKRNKQLEEEVATHKEASRDHAATAQKYKTILASTESILQTLQSSVEQEEKVKSVESDGKVKALMQQLAMKSKLLEELESNYNKLKADSSKQQIAQISQDAGKEDQGFIIIDDQASNMEEQGNEVAKLKERLEREKELTKSLGEAAKKLQALLKQTQDELNKERMKNKNDQAEGDAK